ncbi:hypothetical protein IV102_31190 [bacterium]|nr:hypothetical protein [bacterium]
MQITPSYLTRLAATVGGLARLASERGGDIYEFSTLKEDPESYCKERGVNDPATQEMMSDISAMLRALPRPRHNALNGGTSDMVADMVVGALTQFAHTVSIQAAIASTPHAPNSAILASLENATPPIA